VGSRLHLLGQIATVRGDLDTARRYFRETITLVEGMGSKSLLLRCHADLAEIDWRHGDEGLRGQAIKRLRTVLGEYPPDPTLRDERAALMYQLGAATVVAGASGEAIETLRAGFDLAESDYWRMRLANALSSAHHYVGDPQGGLVWLDEAWRLAESSGSDSFKARILSNRGGLYVIRGNFAEAAVQDRLSAMWARRFGNTFEYAAGRAGSAICAIHLAKYEDALADARETRRAAEILNNYTYLVKSYELEGLVFNSIGKSDLAEAGVSQALAVCETHGYTVVKPRLEWLLAKILKERGQREGSERLLRKAEAQLLETRDLEDLWGVQIEMSLYRSNNGRAETSIDEIETLFRKAEERELLLVTVPAALAISEILHEERLDHVKHNGLLVAGLQMAQGSGMRELAWRLSFRMGALAARKGQRKEAYSRFTLASRLIREIAGELSGENRDFYMRSFHVTSALEQMAPALSN
jgi:tetratricopeptide (TPR) repeat protein